MFKEEEHPRDEDGKFTFKNGGDKSNSSETPAQILYSASMKQKEIKEKEAKYKNKLLDILGDKATPTDILYGNKDSLEKKIKELGLMTGGASGVNQSTTNSKFVRPVDGKIISNFGPRNTTVGSKDHKGIDMRAPIGTPVKTIAGGKVTVAQSGIRGYGTAVYIDHGIINGKKVVSIYGHLSKCNVKVGDNVKPGQVVAKSGNTGVSQAPHLHVTILENGKAVDPKKYIK